MDKTPTPLYISSCSKTDLLRKIKHLCKSLTCAEIFGMSDTMQRGLTAILAHNYLFPGTFWLPMSSFIILE